MQNNFKRIIWQTKGEEQWGRWSKIETGKGELGL